MVVGRRQLSLDLLPSALNYLLYCVLCKKDGLGVCIVALATLLKFIPRTGFAFLLAQQMPLAINVCMAQWYARCVCRCMRSADGCLAF